MLEDRFLDECYDIFSKEQLRLLNDLKSDNDISANKKKESQVHQQVKLLNSLLTYVLKLRSLRKEIVANNIFS
jgi:hypothetical protein